MNLIISAAKDRRWADLDCLARSLASVNCMKVMFVEGVPSDTCRGLEALGWELCDVHSDPALHFQTWRYYPALDFLKNTPGQFRHVFWVDACDVVFQRDPFAYLEQHASGTRYLALAREAWRIKDQGINDVWARRLSTYQEHQLLREYDVLCSGTIAGSQDAMIELFEKMIGRFGDEMQGIDQGILNWVVRLQPLSSTVWAPGPDEGFVATCGTFLAPSEREAWTYAPPVFDRSTGLVMTPDGKSPFVVQHQYNRRYGLFDPDGSWRSIVEGKYRNVDQITA